MTVRTRFAPSPTGSLHVGGARTALYCLLHARHHGGRFLLRIEDTDQTRSSEAAAQGILRDMRWLGLQWDEGPGAEDAGTGPYFQSQRLDRYREVLDDLLTRGLAYEAWDTPEELDALRAEAREAKRNFRYPRRTFTDEDIAARRAAGVAPVVRLATPRHDVAIHDDVLGTVEVPASDLDDHVIRKADGFPTYHFAVVVDDHDMGVSQVVRGNEHLLNTPKHLALMEVLGWEPPRFAHLPLIFNPGGSKMSKRDKAKAARKAAHDALEQGPMHTAGALAAAAGLGVDTVEDFLGRKHDDVDVATAIAAALRVDLPMIEVLDFRRQGYVAEALVNFLGLLGWSPGHDDEGQLLEICSLDLMIERFRLEDVGKTAARFDVEKLTWMNGEYLRALPMDRLLEAHAEYLEVADSPFAGMDDARRARFLDLYRPRMATFADMDRLAAFFFEAPTTWAEKAVQKHLRKGGGFDRLRALREVLASQEDWSPEALIDALEGWGEANGHKMGKVAQPVRVAVTGTGVSPSIQDTLHLLGRDETLARVDACLAAHGEG